MVERTRPNTLARLIPWIAPLAVLSCILPPEEDLPTQMTLTVDEYTKATGEEFSFSYVAQGTALNRVVVQYGDGQSDADSTFFGIYQSAEMAGIMEHAYDVAGSYMVIGWVEDLAVGADTVQLTVDVN